MAARRRDSDADSASSDEGVGYSQRGSTQDPRKLFPDTRRGEAGQTGDARHAASSGDGRPHRATYKGYAPAPGFEHTNGFGSRRPLPPGPAGGGGWTVPSSGAQIAANPLPARAPRSGGGGHSDEPHGGVASHAPVRHAEWGDTVSGPGATVGQLRPLPAGPPPAQALSRPHSFAGVPPSDHRTGTRVYRRPEGSSTASLARAVMFMRQQSLQQLSPTPSRSAAAALSSGSPGGGSGTTSTFNPARAAVASAARIVCRLGPCVPKRRRHSRSPRQPLGKLRARQPLPNVPPGVQQVAISGPSVRPAGRNRPLRNSASLRRRHPCQERVVR